MQMVLVKYLIPKQEPVKASGEHLPIEVMSHSQPKPEPWQNSALLQSSTFSMAQPLFLPQVVGSAME